jgi:CheY-like chemotaxis protein
MPAARRKTVLVVEDDPDTRTALSAALGDVGYQVVGVGDGHAALNYLAANPSPDLILLDMVLPVLDGWHLLAELRKGGRLVSVPVLITTATSAIGRQWAADHGCAGVIPKPVDPGQLLAEVSRCCGR